MMNLQLSVYLMLLLHFDVFPSHVFVYLVISPKEEGFNWLFVICNITVVSDRIT